MSAGAFKQAQSNLRPQKTKKTKNLNFRPREVREFLGRWDKNSETVKAQKFDISGVSLREDKIPGHKFWTVIRIFGIYVLRLLVA